MNNKLEVIGIDHGWLLFCKLHDAPVVTLNDAITV